MLGVNKVNSRTALHTRSGVGGLGEGWVVVVGNHLLLPLFFLGGGLFFGVCKYHITNYLSSDR